MHCVDGAWRVGDASDAMRKTTAPDPVPIIGRLTYTKRELCQALGVSDSTLTRLERRGILKPLPICRHKLYPVEAVHRLLNGGVAKFAQAAD